MSQSRPHATEKLNKELPDAYEKRTWREKLHYNQDGFVLIPANALKNILSEAAKYLSIQIPGKGKSTFTKHFESGVFCGEDAIVHVNGKPLHKDDVEGRWMFVPSDGVRGSGKRVYRCYPMVPMFWSCTVNYAIFDDIIQPDVFLQHIQQAGQIIGLGTFRVRNNGTLGRFRVDSLDWNEYKGSFAEPVIRINGKEAKLKEVA